MVGVAVTGLAEADHPFNADNAAVLYPDALGAPLAYRSKLPGVLYKMSESVAPAGLLRKKNVPQTGAGSGPGSTRPRSGRLLGLVAGFAGRAILGGLLHSTRGNWNPLSGAFWENRGKGKNCSRNPFSSAYCGRSNPTKCSRNPLSRVRCEGN